MNFLLHFSHTLVMETGNWLLGGTIYQEKNEMQKNEVMTLSTYCYMITCPPPQNHTTRSIEAEILEQIVILTLYNTPFVLPSDIQRLI